MLFLIVKSHKDNVFSGDYDYFCAMKMKTIYLLAAITLFIACGSRKNESSENQSTDSATAEQMKFTADFNADSAYHYVECQVKFGPRVPNTEAHRRCAEWLSAELERHGATVTNQRASLKAFDGSTLDAVNIIGQFNPDAPDRILLLAHWDCRPWADADPNSDNHSKPVDGANDGASGVGVLLEIARQIGRQTTDKGIDILFVDAEDWGEEGNDDSWALGSKYFVKHPFKEGYMPSQAILLDMVGGHNAVFRKEYFSMQYAPALVEKLWNIAVQSGFGSSFSNEMGGAITDDHVEFIKAGIPSIDIIDFNPDSETGFNPTWHTVNDNMSGIDRQSLRAVGQTILNYLFP